MGLLLATFAALGNLLGGVLITARRRWSGVLLRVFVATGAGFLLAVAFLRMLPESLALLPDRALSLVLAGYFLTHIFEHTLVPHFHFGEEIHEEIVHRRTGMAALGGLALHSFFDGVSISAGYQLSPYLGWMVFIAIALHKLPEGFTIASIVRAAGGDRRQAMGAATILGAACLMGALVLTGRPGWAAEGLALGTGVTIYVAASDLVPEVNKEVGHHLALMVLAGLLLYFVADQVLVGLVPR